MSKVTINFKFEIGDEVIFKGTRGKKRFSLFKKKDIVDEKDQSFIPAQIFRVTDRKYEECYGGVQLHYNLRAMTYGEGGFSGYEGLLTGISYFRHDGNGVITAREIELEVAQ